MQARKRHELEHELVSVGNLKTGHAASEHHVSALYRTSMAAHAAMEPRAAVADVRPDGVDIHCGSQDPYFVRGLVAKAIRRDADEVIVHSHRLGGGFGGRVRCQAAEEAAVLSAAVGKPVKVQWSREEEFQNNYYQPAFSHYIEAGVTKAGKIGYWDHDFVSSPIITGAVPKELSWITDSIVADEGTARGSTPPWQTAHRRVRYADIRTFVPVGAWRGLGSAPNMFAIESLMDELALGAKIDPLQFRLDNLPEDDIRLRAVLNRIAAMVDLKTSLPSDTGRGLACGTYKGETAVAIVAEVRVDRKSRHVQVRKIWCAQDCGRVINPQLVENQIMGNIIWGCSMALKERLTVADGAMEQTNFDSYDLLRHDEAPDIETSLVQSDDATPTGVGEAALGPVAPAITNAIAAASGVRIRDLPVSLTDLFSTDRA